MSQTVRHTACDILSVLLSPANKLNLGHHYSSICLPTQTASLGLKIGSTVRIYIVNKKVLNFFSSRQFKFLVSSQSAVDVLLAIPANEYYLHLNTKILPKNMLENKISE